MRRVIDHRRAFTLLELLMVVAVLLVFAAMFLGTVGKDNAKAPRIRCVNNLKNVGLAYRIFATDHDELFPWQTETNVSPARPSFDDALKYFRVVSNELSTPNILVCPSDNQKAARDWASFSRKNISYFLSLNSSETYPQSFLAGDRNLLTNGVRIGPGIVEIDSAITNAAWDGTIHRFEGNACMGDGSVQQLSSARLRDQLSRTGMNSMTLAVP
jgi:prepilin-type N-terminal cleavage/methylation domain-containing protein